VPIEIAAVRSLPQDLVNDTAVELAIKQFETFNVGFLHERLYRKPACDESSEQLGDYRRGVRVRDNHSRWDHQRSGTQIDAIGVDEIQYANATST
ncbi:MAG TPA: hypothetical protein VL285_24175, partial [Bryobacteraceae bacterium]|nr:hypothetical protein [Bryobacteraceae bacterium]